VISAGRSSRPGTADGSGRAGPRRGSPTLRRVGGIAVLALFLAAALWWLIAHRVKLADALGRLDAQSIALSLLFGLAGVVAMFAAWRSAVLDGGVTLPARDCFRIYGIGQAGKYLPGSVWPVLTQAQLARRRGADPLRVAAASLLALALGVTVSILLGSALLPFAGAAAVHRLWWVSLLGVPCLVALAPPVLNRLLGIAARVLRRGDRSFAHSTAGIARAAAWTLIGDVLLGLHVFWLVQALGSGGLRAAVLATCAYGLSSALGIVVIFAPAGAGVRDVALAAVLASLISAEAAAVVALVSRALLIVVDLGIAASQLRGLGDFRSGLGAEPGAAPDLAATTGRTSEARPPERGPADL
jgi:uncharacterized membrane protein YbhN (UPF0104 family)